MLGNTVPPSDFYAFERQDKHLGAVLFTVIDCHTLIADAEHVKPVYVWLHK